MDCRHFDEYINPYLDQELDQQDQEQLEKHLNECPRCQKEAEEIQRIIGMVKGLDEESLPLNFNYNLINKLEQRKSFRPVKWLRLAGAIAGVIILLFSMKAIKNVGLMDKMVKDDYSGQEIAEDRGNASNESSQSEQDKEETSSDALVTMDENVDEDKEEHIESPKDDGWETADKASDSIAGSARGIESDVVEVYVQDVCITPQTLKFMAINNELEVVESDENSVIIELSNDEQRIKLYDELSKMGDVKETGQSIGENKVKIVIKNKDE